MLKITLAAVALAAGIAAASAQTQPSMAVTGAWARATPPGAKTGAAYVTVKNGGAAEDRLVATSTPVAGKAQLHETVNANGVMKMRPVEALPIKPGASVAMKPGGYHIMLMNLNRPLKQGETFPLTLTFAQAGPVSVTVKVEKVGAMGMGGDMPGMNMGK